MQEWPIIQLTLLVGVLSVAVSLLPGIALGYALARWRSPLCTLLRALVMLPLVLPPVVTGYLLLAGLGRKSWLGATFEHWTGERIAFTTAACVIAAAVVGFPLLVENIRLSVLAVDGRLEDVSRTLGHSRLSTFMRVTLPLSFPGILTGAILSFARALGEFGATIVLAGDIEGRTRTIPIAVYSALYEVDGEAPALRLAAWSVALSVASLVVATALVRLRQRT